MSDETIEVVTYHPEVVKAIKATNRIEACHHPKTRQPDAYHVEGDRVLCHSEHGQLHSCTVEELKRHLSEAHHSHIEPKVEHKPAVAPKAAAAAPPAKPA